LETKEYPQADLQTPKLSRSTPLEVDEDEEDEEEEDVEEEEEVVDPEDEELVEEWEELEAVDVLPVDDGEVLVVDGDPADIVEEVVEDVVCDVDDDADVVAGVLDDVATLVVLWLDVKEPDEVDVWVTAWHKLGSGRCVEIKLTGTGKRRKPNLRDQEATKGGLREKLHGRGVVIMTEGTML
jgi:hypothetical protein